MKKIMIVGLLKLTLLFCFLIFVFNLFGGFDDKKLETYTGNHLWYNPDPMSFAIDIGNDQVLMFNIRDTEKYNGRGYDQPFEKAQELKAHIAKDSKFFTRASLTMSLYDMLFLKDHIFPRKYGNVSVQFIRSDLPENPGLFDKEQNWPYSTELVFNSPEIISRETFDQRHLSDYAEHFQIPIKTRYQFFKVRSLGRYHSGP